MATVAENVDPNLLAAAGGGGQPPRGGKKSKAAAAQLRASLSPKARRGGRRRRSGSHFGRGAARPAAAARDAESDDDDDDDDDASAADSDIEFTLDGAADVAGAAADSSGGAAAAAAAPSSRSPLRRSPTPKARAARRRRRSSARFLRLSAGSQGLSPARGGPTDGGAAASAEHLGEIYRQAIRMNAENKINAGNSWGLQLIENMDKFLEQEDDDAGGGGGSGGGSRSPAGGQARAALRAARRMPRTDGRGRVNFTKASCTLDASVKIYSYRVDDVHLASYRVLANLHRTDTNKGPNAAADGHQEGDGEEAGEDGAQGTARRRRGPPRAPAETLEANPANINMSKLDAAYDIDPLFHKMSKAFDEGGAKGLLLGNLGVSQRGCHIVFDSKEDEAEEEEDEMEEEEEEEEDEEGEGEEGKDEEAQEDAEDNEDPPAAAAEEAVDPHAPAWREGDVDIADLAAKLAAALASHGRGTSPADVPCVPQLASLREDYARLEEEGYAVDERALGAREGRRRLALYDAPEEEEKEAERSIHVIALERSRGSVLGMSFDTNFRLSMGDLGDHDGDDGPGGGEFGEFGGEGEFAPDFGGAADDDGPDFGDEGGGGFDGLDGSQPAAGWLGAADARASSCYRNSKVLLDALCDGDAFLDEDGRDREYAFFDLRKLRQATDGNLWAGARHWKKRPATAAGKGAAGRDERRRVMFDDDEGIDDGGRQARKRAAKKERVFIDFAEEPDADIIFATKKTSRRTKKSKKDTYQMPLTDKEFLLPPDANVDISQLARLFSRPNSVVRRGGRGRAAGKTVGFLDVEDNALGFADGEDDGADFGGDDDGGGFDFAYDEGGDETMAHDDGADYNLDNFEKVRKVEKINVAYATVAKKVDVRRLKKDLWAELEEKTAASATVTDDEDAAVEETKPGDHQGEPPHASFKQTVEMMDQGQSQSDVTVSFYFICLLHLANEKGLKLDSAGLDDFIISLDDGSAPTFGSFGDGLTETANKVATIEPRSKRQTKKVASYVEEGDADEEAGHSEEEGLSEEE